MNTLKAAILTRKFLWFFLALALSRAGYLYIFGIYAAPETEAWLEGGSMFYPPLYPLVLKGLLFLYPTAWLPVILQILLFSFAFALLASLVFNSDRLFYTLMVVTALDPVSAQFVYSISGLSLSITCMLLSLSAFHVWLRNPGGWLMFMMITGSACAFLLRYQALIFPIVMLLYMMSFPVHRRYFFRTVLIFVAGFQLTLLPMRYYHSEMYGTWRLNAFTGLSLWNNVSVIYCNSAVRVNPRSGFETYVAYKPCGEFSRDHAIRGWHLSDPASTLNQYLKRKVKDVPRQLEFGDALFRTSVGIIIQHPIDYMQEFVFPNLHRVFFEDETRESIPAAFSPKVRSQLNLPGRAFVYFNRYFVWLASALMLFNLLFQLYYHNSLGFISLFNFAYLFSITFMGPLSVADVLFLTPMISLNVLFLWDKLYYRNIYYRFAYRGL